MMRILDSGVAPEWVDYNGHMNDAEYARVFSVAVEALMARIGLGEAGRARYAYTIYTLETHLCYRREVKEGQAFGIDVVLLDWDAKRLHVFMEMSDRDGQCLATSEQMLMGMRSDSRRPASFPAPVVAGIESLPRADTEQWPPLAGSRIGIRR